MNDLNNKNFILAIILSMAIIFGWQYFYAGPLAEKAKKQAEIAQTTTPATTTTATSGGAVQVPAGTVGPLTREKALEASPRLKIDTPDVSGSINLMGAQIDDLHLVRYQETIDPKSPLITLLSPNGSPNAFFAEQGVVGAAGTTARPEVGQWRRPPLHP
jgi:YidC/Oxa1 family membrane protein insertase